MNLSPLRFALLPLFDIDTGNTPSSEKRAAGRLRAQLLCCLLIMTALSSCADKAAPPPAPAEEKAATIATLTWLRSRHGMVRNPDLDRLLERVTYRLSEGAAAFTQTNVPNTPNTWLVYVLNDPAPNAFSLGVNVIVLTKGMIIQTRTEAELAAVIAHEMSHQLLGHTQKALTEAKESNDENRPPAAFSPEDETAADRLSLNLLHRGRYRLEAALGAVSIGSHQTDYRQRGRNVSPGQQSWLAYRMANLHQELAGYPTDLPATESSREFNRARQPLLDARLR